MSKVTSKLQLTVPKAIADQYGIRPGDEVEWIPAGDGIRIELLRAKARAKQELTVEEKLALFDAETERLGRIQAAELKKYARMKKGPKDRGWKREDLYTRGFPR
jgi:AbrB family looped-hinge helix DNA binding protein